MRVLVCGGRHYDDWDNFNDTMKKINATFDEIGNITMIGHGGASGADTMAGIWATHNGIPTKVYKVTQDEWLKLGRAAGPIRNARMLKEFQPDVLVAFPGGRGTGDMVQRAKAHGVKVIEVY
jgi:hypothetical protein